MSKDYFEPDNAERLEKAAANVQDRLLIRLLARLSCRITEVLSLLIEDVSFEQGAITISHLKSCLICPECNARLERAHAFCHNCGISVEEVVARAMEHSRMRTLPIDNDTLEMLRDFINQGGPGFQNGKYLLFGISRHKAWKIIRECANRAGLSPLVNHETSKMRGNVHREWYNKLWHNKDQDGA